MKKTILLTAAALMLSMFNIQAQDEESSDFPESQWQARFRLLSVIPSAGDDLDGAEVGISTAFIPELDFTYFFNRNVAAELILGTAKHNVDVNDDEVDLGHVWLLPPTLNLQYHFYAGSVKPYVGAGVNYTFFYGVDEGDVAGMEYDNSFGFSVQGGIDINLSDKLFLNIDAKKIFLKTDVEVDTGEGVLPVEVDIDPFVVGAGVGLRF